MYINNLNVREGVAFDLRARLRIFNGFIEVHFV